MNRLRRKYTNLLLIMVLLLPGLYVRAQDPVLHEYIRQALDSNEGLKQVQLDYASNLSALKEAKGLFFPDLNLEARYTVANGGRVIEFPVGDLLNPVYNTLNTLTGSNQFPEIENEEFMFYRAKEHETKLRLIQPIFKPELIHNVKIKQQGAEIALINIDQYEQELIREITKAYYNYQKAFHLQTLADTAMHLVKENLRVSNSLFASDKVTKDVVYRSEAEIAKVEVQQAQARKLFEASRSYFNFLLNRDLLEMIRISDKSLYTGNSDNTNETSLGEARISALNNRQELMQIKAYQKLNEQQTALYRGSNLPGLYGVVDYGFQGEEYKFTNEDDFFLASLVLSWNLFQGRTNHHKVQKSAIEGEKMGSIYRQAEQQIELEVINNFYALQATQEMVGSAQKQLLSARRAYNLIHRKYQEGQASVLELIDARTSMTSAASNLIIARSDYFSSLADYNYAIGYNPYNP